MIDSDLHQVDEQPLFLLGRVVARQHNRGVADGLADPLAVVRHVLHRLVETEEGRVEPGFLQDLGKLCRVGFARHAGQVGQQFAVQVAGQVDLRVVAAVTRPQGVRRQRFHHAGEDGRHLGGAVVVVVMGALAAGRTGHVVGERRVLAQLQADARGQRVAGLHGNGRLGGPLRTIEVPDAGIPRHLALGRHVEHRSVASPVGRRHVLLVLVEFGVRHFLAVPRRGVDLDNRDRADDIPVAVDELADVGRLGEGPRDAVLADAGLQGQGIEFRRGRGVGLGIDDRRPRSDLSGRQGRAGRRHPQGKLADYRTQDSHDRLLGLPDRAEAAAADHAHQFTLQLRACRSRACLKKAALAYAACRRFAPPFNAVRNIT